jgi:hypothetical protein
VQEKRARVVELRAKGRTWDAIAAEVGYSNGSAASKAWHAAIRQRPDMAVDAVREQEKARLEYLIGQAVEQIECPGPRTSAIGKVVVFPKGHERAGEIVEDESIRARAIDNARRLSGDLARISGVSLAPGPSAMLAEEQIRMMAEVIVARRDRGAFPAVAAAPADYHAMTPEEQMADDLGRRRLQLIPGDDDVVEAEIVDEPPA